MIATLQFDLSSERESFEAAVKADHWRELARYIATEIFRPARKHGYSESEIMQALNKCGDDGHHLVGLLEKKFFEMLNDFGLSLD